MLIIQRSTEKLIITRSAVIDRIEGIFDSKVPGELRLHFRDETFVCIKRRHALQAMKALSASFGALNGKGDLQEKIKGKKIVYCMTGNQCLRGFTPADEWEGPEMGEGDFLIDRGRCCY